MPDEAQQQILERLARVETKIDYMVNARDIAYDALNSTKSAHLRIDRLDKIVFWAGTTMIGAIIVGAVSLLFKFKGA